MKRISRSEVTGPAPAADPEHFAGPVAQLGLHAQNEPYAMRALVVSFETGARTDWHSHDGGQVLHVLEGSGQTQTRQGPVVDLAAGDIVVAEPGEEHWHGAAPGAGMRHLAISLGATRWMERPE